MANNLQRASFGSVKRALHRSLRLPRTYPRVAQWLFGEPFLPYHTEAQPLSEHIFAASLALRTHTIFHDVAHMFDLFGIDEYTSRLTQQQSAGFALDAQHCTGTPVHLATVTKDMVYTPVARANDAVVVGYIYVTGDAFDTTRTPQQSATFRGRSSLNGRFAYDSDNDHLIIVYNNLTPLVSGIVDITFMSLTRNRSYYTIPNAPYGPKRLPSHVLVLLSVLETRTDPNQQSCDLPLPFASASCVTDITEFTTDPPNSNDDIVWDQIGKSALNINFTSHEMRQPSVKPVADVRPGNWLADVRALKKDIHNLTLSLQGVYSCTQMRRDMCDPLNPEVVISTESGSVTSMFAMPSMELKREMIARSWEFYKAWLSTKNCQGAVEHARSAFASIDDSMGSYLHGVKYLIWPGFSSPTSNRETHKSDALTQTDNLSDEESFHKSSLNNAGGPGNDRFKHLENENCVNSENNDCEMGRIEEVDGPGDYGGELSSPERCTEKQLSSNDWGSKEGLESANVETHIKRMQERQFAGALSSFGSLIQHGSLACVSNVSPGQSSSTLPQSLVLPVPMTMAVPVCMPLQAVSGSEGSKNISKADRSRIAKKDAKCHACKGLFGRKGVVLVDEDTMRIQKLEAKKRKNRLSAARSNEKRKEREEKYWRDLDERRERIVVLRERRSQLEAENKELRLIADRLGIRTFA